MIAYTILTQKVFLGSMNMKKLVLHRVSACWPFTSSRAIFFKSLSWYYKVTMKRRYWEVVTLLYYLQIAASSLESYCYRFKLQYLTI